MAQGVRYSVTAFVRFLEPQGRSSDIEAAWRLGVALGEFNARKELADHLLSEGRTADAEAVLSENLAAGDLNAGKSLARFLIGEDRLDEARDVLLSALRAGETTAIGLLFDLLLERGELSDAEHLLEDPAVEGSGMRNLMLARLKEATGDDTAAEGLFRAAVAAWEPGAADAWASFTESRNLPEVDASLRPERGFGLTHDELYGPALNEDAARVAIWRDEWGASLSMIEFLAAQGRLPEAEDVARIAVVFGEYCSYSNLGAVFSDLGREEDAIRALWAGVATGETI